VLPLSVEEGIANGVPEVRQAVRYQIKHGARLIKISASGGVMSHSGAAGAQQYSDEEIAAIVDEAHRAGLRVAAHAHGDAGIRACIRAGVDCIEHGSLASDSTIEMMVEHGTFLVPTSYLSEGLDISMAAPELQAKAAEVFPKAREMLRKAIAAGVKIACGTDAPAVPHGQNAKELWAMVDRGMTPMQALQAATTTSAELIERDHDLGRLAAGYLADIIAVPGDPSKDITLTEHVRFVMKDGQVFLGT
jgi:imidazolonepropionase-like amidohydrolase